MTHVDTGAGREEWGSRVGFLLAAAGSAIGLGNIWRFTYIMGQNGGAAFILVYLIWIVLIGAPVFLGELVIGRHTQLNPVGAFRALKPGTRWVLVGGMGVAAGGFLLSFYSVIGGWVLYYAVTSPVGIVSSFATPEQAGAAYDAVASDPWWAIGCHLLFMLPTIFIVSRGVRGGIEAASKVMMPVLIGLIGLLIVRGVTLPGAWAGIEFLIRPDFSRLTPGVMLEAMGHAFFTLSVGMGAMITYGSYLSHEHDLPRSTLQIAAMDTLVAVAAGFAIFPALFAFNMEPAQGEALIFNTLPVVFSQIPAGALFATVFFALLFIAALTSSISLLEVVSSYAMDEWRLTRAQAAWGLGIAAFGLGIPSALSPGVMADWSIASMLGATPGEGLLGTVAILQMNWFGLISTTVSNYMLPLGGLATCLFVGWVWDQRVVDEEVHLGSPRFLLAGLWIKLLRYVGPLAVLQVLFLGALAEFPAQYYPGIAAFADRLNSWFLWIDVLAAAVVVVAGIRDAMRLKAVATSS